MRHLRFPLPFARRPSTKEKLLKPPPLPQAQHLPLESQECTIEYIDLPSLTPSSSVAILVHGAPGSYADYKYILPHLNQHMRVIGMNYPGAGQSKVHQRHEIEAMSCIPAARMLLHAANHLCSQEEDVFMIGHSFGAHGAMNMAALNRLELIQQERLNVRGLVLLASAGIRPHHILRPKANAAFVRLLQTSDGGVSPPMSWASKFIYTRLLGFSKQYPANHYVSGIVRSGSVDFDVMKKHVGMIKDDLPTFCAWAANDEFMEKEIPIELEKMLGPGPRLEFAKGGHNIQKTRAEDLAKEIKQWSEGVLAGREMERQEVIIRQ